LCRDGRARASRRLAPSGPHDRHNQVLIVVRGRRIEIRLLTAGEGPQVRALRLRALRDAPRAFASSLELELARPDAHWDNLARRSASGEAAGATGAEGAADASVVWVATDAGRWRAMAGSFWFDRPAGIAQLWGMWVEPSARGRGLGSMLVDVVAGWATDRGALRLRLGVVDRAPEAVAFYERLGFTHTGETRSLPPDGASTAFFFAKVLGP
jgi:GNAT superfamily N-acetyltransferase